VTGWRETRNGELHNLYSSQNIIKVNKPRWMRWAEYVARKRGMRHAKKIVEKTRRKRTAWRKKRKCEDVKVEVTVQWINQTRDRVQWQFTVNTILKLQASQIRFYSILLALLVSVSDQKKPHCSQSFWVLSLILTYAAYLQLERDMATQTQYAHTGACGQKLGNWNARVSGICYGSAR
jgi:hypothetical protein